MLLERQVHDGRHGLFVGGVKLVRRDGDGWVQGLELARMVREVRRREVAEVEGFCPLAREVVRCCAADADDAVCACDDDDFVFDSAGGSLVSDCLFLFSFLFSFIYSWLFGWLEGGAARRLQQCPMHRMGG